MLISDERILKRFQDTNIPQKSIITVNKTELLLELCYSISFTLLLQKNIYYIRALHLILIVFILTLSRRFGCKKRVWTSNKIGLTRCPTKLYIRILPPHISNIEFES